MSGLPREALVPGKRTGRQVLVFAELTAPVRAELKEQGATLVDAESVLGAVALLADRDFDAAIFDMTLSAELVKRVKAGVGEIEEVPDALAARARARHRATPFFLVNDELRRFTVVVDPPEHSYVEDELGLVHVVMSLDVSRLVMRGAALA